MLVLSTPSFNKDISKVKDAKLAARIEQVIREMEKVNKVSELTGIKKMAGASNAYRIRIGDYRLGFLLVENKIRLTVFAHRKEVYRYFP